MKGPKQKCTNYKTVHIAYDRMGVPHGELRNVLGDFLNLFTHIVFTVLWVRDRCGIQLMYI